MGKFIGLGIIIVSIIVAIIAISWMVKFIISFSADHIKYGKNPKPWLRKKEWVNKKVIWKGAVDFQNKWTNIVSLNKTV